MDSFGSRLKHHRKLTVSPITNRPFSQTGLAKEIANQSGITFSYGTVSAWERNALEIKATDRVLLKTIVKILANTQGLRSLEEANQLLLSGKHTPLNDTEIAEVFPAWGVGKSVTFKLPSDHTQLAALPTPVNLIGRSGDLASLEVFLTDPNFPSVLFITGMGGIGKSALAATLARQQVLQDRFQSVAWLPFPSLSAESDILAAISLQLGEWLNIDPLNRVSDEARFSQVQKALQSVHHLIIIDGVEEADYAQVLADQLWRLDSPTRFVVTSRIYPQRVEQTHIYQLQPLSKQAAHELLIERTIRTGGTSVTEISAEIAASFYRLVGGHPLTLGYLPHLLAGMAPSALIEMLKAGEHFKQERLFERIWAELSPQTKAVAFGLTLLGQHGSNLYMLAAGLALQADQIAVALDTLFRFGLLESQESKKDRTYRLHSLVIQFVQSWLSEQPDTKGWPKITGRMFQLWQDNLPKLDQPAPFEAISQYHHAILISQHLKFGPEGRQLRARFLIELFPYLQESGWLNLWVTVWQNVLLETHEPKTAITLHNQLGLIMQQRYEPIQAIEQHQQALTIAKKHKLQTEQAISQDRLGWSYFLGQDIDKAIEHNGEALELFSEVDESGPEVGKALNNRGILFAEKKAFDEAERYFNLAINAHREAGAGHMLAQVSLNLGLLYRWNNQPDKSQAAYEKGLKQLSVYPKRLHEAHIRISYGTMLYSYDRYHEALTQFEAIDLQFLEQGHHFRFLGLTYNNLASVLIKLGNFQRAEQLLKRSLTFWEEVKHEMDAALIYDTFGNLYTAQNLPGKAKQYYAKAYRRLEQHPPTIERDKFRDKLRQKLNIGLEQ